MKSPEQYSRFLTGKRRLSLGPARRDSSGKLLPVELGIDLTGRLPLDAERYAVEFQLDRDDPEIEASADGIVLAASLRRYEHDGTLIGETPFVGLPKRMKTERRSVLLEVGPP